MRATIASMSTSFTAPAAWASHSASPRWRVGPGISMSSPASSDSTPLCVPFQSLTTTPSNPHSLPQHLADQPVVLRAVRAMEAVVGSHHRSHPGPHGRFERNQVHLSQHPFRHVDVDDAPRELGVVAHEVLHAARDALRLDAFDVRRGDRRGQQRIFAQALEVAPADRSALEIDRRAEQHVRTLGTRLATERPTDLADELGVERRGERRSARERGRGGTLPRGATHSGRAVGHPDRGDLARRGRVPGVDAGEQRDALVQVHTSTVSITDDCSSVR